jgi:hypothetical protein
MDNQLHISRRSARRRRRIILLAWYLHNQDRRYLSALDEEGRQRRDRRIEIPSDEKVVELYCLTRLRHPLLTDIFAVADGLKLYFQQCDGLDEESMYCNGWKHDHFITNVRVFSIDGRMIATVTNAPGSLHDSTLA